MTEVTTDHSRPPQTLMTSMATNYSLADTLLLRIIQTSGGPTVLSGPNANANSNHIFNHIPNPLPTGKGR